jgi:hypothetical protein
MLTSPLTPEVIWGLLPRVIGGVFLISLASLLRQVVPLVGSRGIAPVGERLNRLRQDYPGIRCYFDRPTLLWLHSSDRFLQAIPILGCLGGCLAIYGGPLGWWGLLLCWLCYLSLDVCGLWLPWDTMLFEAGFLALFLPAVKELPEVAATSSPLASVAFLFQWLVIRLMWGFAKLKFIGTEKGDSLYLHGFLCWQPMPTPLGWYLQHLPLRVLRGMCYFMAVAEIGGPLLACFTGSWQLLGALLLIMLMVGIGTTGNWGHFNVGYAGLCLCLLDTSTSILDLSVAGVLAAPLTEQLVHTVMGVLFLLSLIFFPFNSWVTQSWTHWCFKGLLRRRRWLTPILEVIRFLNHFRLVGSYGVVPPNSSPPMKMVPVIEGSEDGENWRAYSFAYMPTQDHSPPRFVAPHHPRLDHSSIYAGLGLTESDSVSALMFEVRPSGVSPYSHYSWLHRLLQRILEGEPAVLRLLGDNPFPNAPPKWVRVVHQCLRPTSLAERRGTGKWWSTRTMAVIFPPTRKNPLVWRHWIAEPECLHPDLRHWRRRSPALQAMLRAAGQGYSLKEAVLVGSDLSPALVRRFWDELVPFVADPVRRNRWEQIEETALALQRMFGEECLLDLERIQQRYVYLLQQKLEPYAFDRLQPHMEVESYFHFQVALQAFLFDGETAVEQLWQFPEGAAQRARTLDDAERLYPTAIFRWEMVRYVILTQRSRTELSRAPEMPLGIGRMKEFLLAQRIAPQWLPDCTRSPDGLWEVGDTESHQKPPVRDDRTMS